MLNKNEGKIFKRVKSCFVFLNIMTARSANFWHRSCFARYHFFKHCQMRTVRLDITLVLKICTAVHIRRMDCWRRLSSIKIATCECVLTGFTRDLYDFLLSLQAFDGIVPSGSHDCLLEALSYFFITCRICSISEMTPCLVNKDSFSRFSEVCENILSWYFHTKFYWGWDCYVMHNSRKTICHVC